MRASILLILVIASAKAMVRTEEKYAHVMVPGNYMNYSMIDNLAYTAESKEL